jgi:WD40 repeat protein
MRACVRLRCVHQVITGSHDKTVRLWDLRKAKTISTLTYHKKSVRAMVMHPQEYAFASASADNIKKFRLPQVPPPPQCRAPHTHVLMKAAPLQLWSPVVLCSKMR